MKTFVLDPQNGLKKKIEDVFNGINTVLDELKIQDVVDEIKSLLQPVNDALAKVEFKPIIDAVLQAINTITGILKTVAPLLVTDALKQKLADAAAFLQQIKDFGKMRKRCLAQVVRSNSSRVSTRTRLGALQADTPRSWPASRTLIQNLH